MPHDLWSTFAELIRTPFHHEELVWGIVPLYFSWVVNELTSAKATFNTAIQTGFALLWAGAHWAWQSFRDDPGKVVGLGTHGLFAVNGILFNHESPRRGETFVTRKLARAAARIKLGIERYVYMGNMDAVRDWGYAPEYVEGMWRMLQQPEGDDYVLATNETHTVREFVEVAFAHVGLDWQEFVKHDARYERPAEVDLLIGNPAKAKAKLGWAPTTRFRELVQIMVDADLAVLG